jgi:hypothetical protein
MKDDECGWSYTLKSCKGMDLGSKREGGREGGRERGRQCLGAGLSECRSQ